MPILPFPEYAPDLAALGSGISQLIQGCVPRKDGYGPYKTMQSITGALPGVCRGLFFARKSDGSIVVFGATATDIYQLSNATFLWVLASKGGVSYTPIPTTDVWSFVQFNDTVVACQANTVPQKFVLSTDTNFSDLGGSPPQAARVTVVGGFLVLNGLTSATRRVQWSDLYGIETWTAGVGFADFQDLADGGTVKAVVGGDYYGVIFQDDRIRRMLYVPGSATVFDILVIATEESIIGQYSPVVIADKVYYCSTQGFRVITFGMPPQPIGKERVDRTFQADIDLNNLQLFQGAIDPSGTRVVWAYKSVNGNTGRFDKAIVYDYGINRWTVLPLDGEMLDTLAKPGISLENLDALALPQISVTGAANNGSGAIRLAVSALTAGGFSLGTVGNPTQNFITVQSVVGTTEANGSWAYTIIDGTHIDLIGSTFTNAYVSGGKIGGSLDSMTVSLDTYAKTGQVQLAAVNSAHMMCFFTGPNMEAIIESSEQEADGNETFVTSIRPLTDAATGMVSLGYRQTVQQAVAYSPETAIDTQQGQAPCLVEARYQRGRLRIPAGSVWTYASGLQPEAQVAGET